MNANYIAGEWVAGASARTNINPSDVTDSVGEYAQADAEQARQAIRAAADMRHAWAGSGIELRANALDFIGAELIGRQQELGTLLAREQGKTLPEAIAEVVRAGHIFKFFGAEALRLRGDKLASVRPDVEVEITREPVGVVGIITPWNFPAAIPAWKIAPALAYGNAVVFKPADLVPGSAWALAEIISRSGIAPGVFNLVMGRGSVVGQAMVESSSVTAISFTGSVGTGRQLMATAARRFAKVQLEMGGKNPLLILNDADLEVAVACAVQGAYFSTGQRCTASSRFIVEKGVYPEFVRRVTETLAALKVGHALRPDTHIGPVVDASQLAQNLEYVDIGKAEGARLAFGGSPLKQDTEGFFMSPAFFTDATPAMRISQEEIFGPVACAIPADSYEHALDIANASPLGLSAGICTTSLKHATHFKRHVQSGMVMVNVPTAGVDYHVPFGGTKGSSYGSREQGSYAAEFYTTIKTAYTKA
jgi:acyl-CoA reductase-like NAD-dependent aldehyde dehydrogenase